MHILCSFFNFGKKKTNFGVVKIHANPYFTESLSYLSYESMFGVDLLEFFRVAESKLNKGLTYKMAVLQTLVDIEHHILAKDGVNEFEPWFLPPSLNLKVMLTK